MKNEERTFFFLFCFLAFHFLKPLKFVWVYKNGQFLPGKIIVHAGKKIRKSDFAPSEKYPSYAPGGRGGIWVEDGFNLHVHYCLKNAV